MGSDVQETVQALEAVKADLLEHGWHQGDYYSDYADMREFRAAEGASACLLGACARATGRSFLNESGYLWPTSLALKATLGGTIGGIGYWNDEPGRTFNEVIDLIDRTILDVKAGVGEPDGT